MNVMTKVSGYQQDYFCFLFIVSSFTLSNQSGENSFVTEAIEFLTSDLNTSSNQKGLRVGFDCR